MKEYEGLANSLYRNLNEFTSFCFFSYNGGDVLLSESATIFVGLRTWHTLSLGA
jgi:hypothetical protein